MTVILVFNDFVPNDSVKTGLKSHPTQLRWSWGFIRAAIPG